MPGSLRGQDVTVLPTSINAVLVGGGLKDTIKPPVSQDTTVVDFSTIPVRVTGVGDTGVKGVVVHYTITRTLASNDAKRPAVFITTGPYHATGSFSG